MPSGAVQPAWPRRAQRTALGPRASLPLALQAIYLICLPLAAREGVGAVTSFGYAYLPSAVVAVTASSLGLVTSVPLTRAGLDAAARRTATSSPHRGSRWWSSERPPESSRSQVNRCCRPCSETDTSTVSARSSAAWCPRSRPGWSRRSGSRSRFLSCSSRIGLFAWGDSLALVIGISLPLAALGQAAGGLSGLALALAATTVIALGGVLHALGAARDTLLGLGRAAGLVLIIAAVAFVPAGLLLPPVAAAVAGLAAYGILVAVVRPYGLHSSWRYLRALE